jgi:prefoldin subunit 5
MKTARIISFIVVAGMLAGALALAFPGAAHAQGTNPPPPPTDSQQQVGLVRRLESAYQRELKALEAQADRLDGADERAENFTERIANLKSEGKDTSVLEEALGDFKNVLKEARTAHDQAAAALKTHAGFDDQGKVNEVEKARETVREAEKLLREAHRDLRPALRDLMRAFREFTRDNRKK